LLTIFANLGQISDMLANERGEQPEGCKKVGPDAPSSNLVLSRINKQ